MKIMVAFIGSLFLSTAAFASAPDNDVIAVADAYMQAYQAQDHDAMERLYAEDAVFIDPTSVDAGLPNGPVMWSGRREIMAHLRPKDGVESSLVLDYDVYTKFEHSGVVVYAANVSYVYETEDQTWNGLTPVITVISVRDGKVVEHRDYTDYTTGNQNAEIVEAD